MSKKTIFFDGYCGYLFAAVAEDNKITEFNFEKSGNGSLVGNIYKGRVERVLAGMQAAFVNCGLEKNCYISADDIFPDAAKYFSSSTAPEFPELKEGDEILVQVVKPPVGTKGARVTTKLSFVGKSLIYLPDTPFVGVSRKILDGELRKNLIYSAEKLIGPNEGLIVRTAAPYLKRNQIMVELSYLKNLYDRVYTAAAVAPVGKLLYTDLALPMRIMRDTLSYDIEKIIVGNKKLEEVITSLVDLYPSESRRPVVLHDTGRDMLEEYGLAGQIAEIASPRVKLENGANLVIEKCEAMTVIDVNTGKFTGDYNLEQTVYQTNIMAAREIARQVKLRNIGGIIIVDFIDMLDPAHRKSLVEELERSLKSDSAKCAVSPMSKLGLVEFSRKRTGTSPLTLMTKPCLNCRGGGYVKSNELIAWEMRAKLLNLCINGAQGVRIDLNAELLEKFLARREFIDDLKEHCKNTEIYFVPHKSYGGDKVNYRTDIANLPPNAVKI
ncbi:MAG: Rne/Rng family ribonuclease [Clostridia bacterium]|nr:Rne/Rng family ribonuclease [Clostridia bacterium]